MINCERGVENSLSKLGRHGGFWGSNQSCVECEKVERGLALKAVWISNRSLWVGGYWPAGKESVRTPYRHSV